MSKVYVAPRASLRSRRRAVSTRVRIAGSRWDGRRRPSPSHVRRQQHPGPIAGSRWGRPVAGTHHPSRRRHTHPRPSPAELATPGRGNPSPPADGGRHHPRPVLAA